MSEVFIPLSEVIELLEDVKSEQEASQKQIDAPHATEYSKTYNNGRFSGLNGVRLKLNMMIANPKSS